MTSSTSSYARILAHYPYVVIAVVFVVAATCLVVSVTVGDRPDFDDPKAGFESRGTEISDRLITKHNLDNTLDLDHRLTLTPYSYQQNDNIKQRTRQHQRKGKKKGRKKQRKRPGQQNSTRDQVTERWDNDLDRGFCQETPDPRYIRIVFSAVDGENLFTLKNIKSMCAIERDIQESYPRRKFKKICGKLGKHCCLSWSLGNYIALLSNKTFCEEIVESDVDDVMALLLSCGEYYHSYQLNLPCDSAESSCNISSRCREYSAVYSILHYLTDIRFLRPDRDKSEPDKLQFSISFFPIAQSVSTLEFYRHLEKRNLRHGNVYIMAANFGIKYTLFDEYLLSDTVWLIIAACVIFCAIWLYSTSLFVTVMAILAMFWSLEIAYFIYMMVFEIKFFPYMNMVTVIIMIGVGADDTLIYCKVWHLSKSERNNGTLEKIITDTLKHATLSMLVTSLTSAAAFLSNYVSNITAIRCFSVFAGTAMLTNYVLMVTWIPATIVVYEKWCNCSICYQSEFQSTRSLICGYLHQAPFRIYNSISDWSRILFEKLLPCMVIKLRCFWIFSLGLLGVGGIVVIFHHPRLQLPSSREFRLFAGNHLMEVYDFEMVKHFQFEKDSMDNAPSMPVTVVWGVLPVDNGNHLEPKNQGSLEFDENFKLSTAKAQRWLLDFCSRLKQQSFYKPSPGTQWSNCFLEHFKLYMERPCELSGMDECCEGSFPYTEDVLTRCLSRYIPSLMATPGVVYTRKSPGPRFTDGKISALIVQFPTAVPFSLSYDDMAGFYSSVNRWVTEQMVNAPDEMSGGWFVSDLSFYDLQNSLVHGTPLAIGLSVAVAAVVIFFTTLNLLISIYAVITIACIIFVTIGSLALLGWELNILESVVITIAIGMSVDFTLHYAVAYRLSPDLDREMRVVCSVGHTGSAISMAAVTTFLAGALMMPSTVLVYRQFGIFLMLIMSVSWIYSTFFFQSLLRTFGPQGGFGQFHWPSFDCCSSNHREHIDKTIYALSESTLSSSSTSYPNHPTSESHELETLTDGSDTFHHRHHSHHMQLYRGGRQRHSYAPTRTEESPVHTPRRQTHVTFEPPPLNTVISPLDKDCDNHSHCPSDAVIKQCDNVEEDVEQQTLISGKTLSDTANSPVIPQENEENPLLGEQEKQSHAQNTHLICLDEQNETVDIQNNHLPSQNVLPQENHQQNSPCSHVDHQNPQDNQNHLLDSHVEEDQSQLLKSQNMDLGGGEKQELGSQSIRSDVVNPSIGALLLSVAPSVEDIVPTTRTADFIKPETQNGGEFLEPFLEPQAV